MCKSGHLSLHFFSLFLLHIQRCLSNALSWKSTIFLVSLCFSLLADRGTWGLNQ